VVVVYDVYSRQILSDVIISYVEREGIMTGFCELCT